MAEKGVAEESISQRLSRKRESFENKKIQDESRRIKRRRRDCPRGDEVTLKKKCSDSAHFTLSRIYITFYIVSPNHILT